MLRKMLRNLNMSFSAQGDNERNVENERGDVTLEHYAVLAHQVTQIWISLFQYTIPNVDRALRLSQEPHLQYQ